MSEIFTTISLTQFSFQIKPIIAKKEPKMITSKIPEKKALTSPNIYPAVGPYSQAILNNNHLYISGLLGLDKNGVLIPGGFKPQTQKILEYLDAILNEAGISKSHLLHLRVYLTDINDFTEFNSIYTNYLQGTTPPTRECLQVAKLPKNASIEIIAEATL